MIKLLEESLILSGYYVTVLTFVIVTLTKLEIINLDNEETFLGFYFEKYLRSCYFCLSFWVAFFLYLALFYIDVVGVGHCGITMVAPIFFSLIWKEIQRP